MILGTLFDDFGYPEGLFWRSGGYLGIVWVQRVILEAKNVTKKYSILSNFGTLGHPGDVFGSSDIKHKRFFRPPASGSHFVSILGDLLRWPTCNPRMPAHVC